MFQLYQAVAFSEAVFSFMLLIISKIRTMFKYCNFINSPLWFNLTHIWVFFKIYGGILEKAMATHSNTLAWKIPWTEEPGRLQYMGSRRVGHDWSDLAAAEMAPDSARERDWNKFFSERKWHVGTQRKGSYDMLINNKHVFSCLSWHWAPKTCNFSSD